MEKDFWLDTWQEEEIEFDQPDANPHLATFLPELKLAPKATVFVPLCGKSIDMVWLKEQNFKVVGCELSPIACKEFFESHQLEYKVIENEQFQIYQGKDIKILCGDFFSINTEQLGPIDAIYDRASLIALPPSMRKEYVDKLLALAKTCPMLLICVTYDQNEMAGPPFSVAKQEVNELYGKRYEITEVNHFDFPEIPEHFKLKGLTHASEQVYVLSKP